jgi:hypothetical protein
MIACASLSLTPIAKHYSFREMKRVRMKFINAAHRIIRIIWQLLDGLSHRSQHEKL